MSYIKLFMNMIMMVLNILNEMEYFVKFKNNFVECIIFFLLRYIIVVDLEIIIWNFMKMVE